MTDQELERLAQLVAARLTAHVVPAVLPAYIGKALRKALAGGTQFWLHYIQLAGSEGINVTYALTPAGEILIEMKDSHGSRFWEGTLVAERADT